MSDDDDDENETSFFLYTGEDDGAFPPSDVTHVRVDPSVKIIPAEAFSRLAKLKRVDLPPGLEEICERAFYYCPIERLTIPIAVEVIADGAFERSSLSEVVIPPSAASRIKAIPANAFSNCRRLARLQLPDSVEIIGPRAFSSAGLLNFRIPPRVTELELGAFDACKSLFSLEMPEGIERRVKRSRARFGLACKPSLRNVFLPPSCEEDLFGPKPSSGTYSRPALREIFPKATGKKITTALKRRFDNLPVHEACYYSSYRSANAVIDAINGLATGKRRDCLGMTPLHILTCSQKQTPELHRALIRKYPEDLLAKDKWGALPIHYAFRANNDSPGAEEIVRLLLEGQTRQFPKKALDWGKLVVSLFRAAAPLASFRSLFRAKERFAPDFVVDWQRVVVTKLSRPSREGSRPKPWLDESFVFILRTIISHRLDLLRVPAWRTDIESCVRELPEDGTSRKDGIDAIFSQLGNYENLKEAAFLLELVVWKAKIDDDESSGHGQGEARRKKARIDECAVKAQRRVNCGADVIIPNILPYLLPERSCYNVCRTMNNAPD